MPTNPIKVLIVGAGIGGLTAALCCLQRGMDVEIFERTDTLGEVGAGIQLPPNAMKVFAKLGLTNVLKAVSFAPTALEARLGEDGRKIFSVPTEADRWGAPYLNIHRAEYIEVLKNAVLEHEPKALNLNAEVSSFRQDARKVTIKLSDGRDVSGDVLIGADGIKSRIGKQLLGPHALRFTGNAAWRAVVSAGALSGPIRETSCVWFGRSKHAVTYPVRGGELVNFVGVVEREEPLSEGWQERGEQDQLLADFAGWDPYITDILQNTDPEALYMWGLYDRAPLTDWARGNAALLGDSAHPMLPFMAQGAAMAVEDAWVLSEALAEQPNIPAALEAYFSRRHARAAMAQKASRANMKTFHRRTTLGQIATYGPMWLAGSYAPSIIRQRLDRFYAHDVTGNLG